MSDQTEAAETLPPEPEVVTLTQEQIDASLNEPTAAERQQVATRAPMTLDGEARAVGAFMPRDTDELMRTVDIIIRGGVVPKGFTYLDGARRGQPDKAKMAVAILAGREVGYGPMMSLRSIMVVNGLASVWGAGAKALVSSKNVVASDRRYWIDVDSEIRTPRFAQGKEAAVGLEARCDTLRADGFIKLYIDAEEVVGAKPMKIPAANEATSAWPKEFGRVVVMTRRGVDGAYIGRFSVGDARRAKLWDNPKKLYGQYPADMLDARAWARAANAGFSDCLMGLAIRELLDEREDSTPQIVNAGFLEDKTDEPTEPQSNP